MVGPHCRTLHTSNSLKDEDWLQQSMEGLTMHRLSMPNSHSTFTISSTLSLLAQYMETTRLPTFTPTTTLSSAANTIMFMS